MHIRARRVRRDHRSGMTRHPSIVHDPFRKGNDVAARSIRDFHQLCGGVGELGFNLGGPPRAVGGSVWVAGHEQPVVGEGSEEDGDEEGNLGGRGG